MNFFSCILLMCLAAFTLVGCNGKEPFSDAAESIVDKRDLFQNTLVHNNRIYLISTIAPKNVDDAMMYCYYLGGFLAEIDDINELLALQNFALNSAAKDYLLISGSDARDEGLWRSQLTGQPVQVLYWFKGQPNNGLGRNEDCLFLWKSKGAKMNDQTCDFQNLDIRFMCEIPITY